MTESASIITRIIVGFLVFSAVLYVAVSTDLVPTADVVEEGADRELNQIETSDGTVNVVDVKKEMLCMEKSSYSYDEKAEILGELEFSLSTLEEVYYALEDRGYLNIRRGLFSSDGSYTAKFYGELDSVNASYCNQVLRYTQISSGGENR